MAHSQGLDAVRGRKAVSPKASMPYDNTPRQSVSNPMKISGTDVKCFWYWDCRWTGD